MNACPPIILPVNDASFQPIVLKSPRTVIVKFTSEYCYPCKKIQPVLQAFAEKNAPDVRVVEVDVNYSPQTAQQYHIMSLPTFYAFKGGEVVGGPYVGAQPTGVMDFLAMYGRIDW